MVRLGLLATFAGIAVLLGAIDPTANARIVTVPLLLAGLRIGTLASQLGAVTGSAMPDEPGLDQHPCTAASERKGTPP